MTPADPLGGEEAGGRPGPGNAREPLPGRRYCESVDFRHDGHRFTATIGFYDDGRPGEVFLRAGKSETALESMCRDLGVVASIALQHGAPMGTIAKALTRLSDGRPAGPLGALLETIAVRLRELQQETVE